MKGKRYATEENIQVLRLQSAVSLRREGWRVGKRHIQWLVTSLDEFFEIRNRKAFTPRLAQCLSHTRLTLAWSTRVWSVSDEGGFWRARLPLLDNSSRASHKTDRSRGWRMTA